MSFRQLCHDLSGGTGEAVFERALPLAFGTLRFDKLDPLCVGILASFDSDRKKTKAGIVKVHSKKMFLYLFQTGAPESRQTKF